MTRTAALREGGSLPEMVTEGDAQYALDVVRRIVGYGFLLLAIGIV